MQACACCSGEYCSPFSRAFIGNYRRNGSWRRRGSYNLSMPQLKSQGINLLFFIPIAIAAVAVYGFKKQIKWKLVAKIAAWGLVGTAGGLLFTNLLGGDITAKIFGGMLIIIGISEIGLFGKKEK